MSEPGLASAISTVIRDLRSQGRSTRDIATRLGVADPTVTRWENGTRLPNVELLPQLDALCGKPRGYVLRRAGYVEDQLNTLAMIESDPALDEEGRNALRLLYRVLTARAASARTAEHAGTA